MIDLNKLIWSLPLPHNNPINGKRCLGCPTLTGRKIKASVAGQIQMELRCPECSDLFYVDITYDMLSQWEGSREEWNASLHG